MIAFQARKPCQQSPFLSARQAVAALEFGILAPVMALLLVAVYDLGKAAILYEQVWSAADSIAESATTLAIQRTNASELSAAQVNLVLSEIYAQIPWVAAGIATGPYTGTGMNAPNTITAVLSSVNYGPAPHCTTTTPNGCPYSATVEWSEAYNPPNGLSGFNSTAYRKCGPLKGSGIPTTLLDTKDYGTDGTTVYDAFLMADVSVIFTPFGFSFITGKLTLSATSYVPVRSNFPGQKDAAQFAILSDFQGFNPSSGCDLRATKSASG